MLYPWCGLVHLVLRLEFRVEHSLSSTLLSFPTLPFFSSKGLTSGDTVQV